MRAEVLSWDGAHQKWSNLVQPQENSGGGAGNHSGPVHMEIDRTKGKSGKSGKNPLLRDHGTWYVMELCEPLDSLIDFTAPFYGHTDNHNRQRKKPSFDDEQPALFEETHHDVVIDIAPENEVVGQEVAIEVAERGGDGAEVPLAGRIVFKPAPTDQLLVNSVELILLAETPPPPPGNSRLPPS